jgi:hypothetical protein
MKAPQRKCTCHPDDNPPVPCAEQYAYSECVAKEKQMKLTYDEIQQATREEIRRMRARIDKKGLRYRTVGEMHKLIEEERQLEREESKPGSPEENKPRSPDIGG